MYKQNVNFHLETIFSAVIVKQTSRLVIEVSPHLSYSLCLFLKQPGKKGLLSLGWRTTANSVQDSRPSQVCWIIHPPFFRFSSPTYVHMGIYTNVYKKALDCIQPGNFRQLRSFMNHLLLFKMVVLSVLFHDDVADIFKITTNVLITFLTTCPMNKCIYYSLDSIIRIYGCSRAFMYIIIIALGECRVSKSSSLSSKLTYYNE